MKRSMFLMMSVAVLMTAVSCGSDGNDNGYYPGSGLGGWTPGTGGGGGAGGAACSIPANINPNSDGVTDLDRTFVIVKEPDWVSGNFFGPSVSSQGTLEIHTRKVNGSNTQIAFFGNISIDLTAFYVNFFNWSFQPPATNIIPYCFSNVNPMTGVPVPGLLVPDYYGSQILALDQTVGYTAPVTGGMYGVSSASFLTLYFMRAGAYPVHSPRFHGNQLYMAGDFEIWVNTGSNSNPWMSGYGGSQRSIWQIVSN